MRESKGTLCYRGVDLYFNATFRDNGSLYNIEISTYFVHPTTGWHLIDIDTVVDSDARLACEIEAEALLDAEHERAEQAEELWRAP